MTLTFDKLIMFNVNAHLLTFDLKTLLKSLHTLYGEAFCGWSTSQIGQRGHMTHSLDEDNTYRSSMTLTLEICLGLLCTSILYPKALIVYKIWAKLHRGENILQTSEAEWTCMQVENGQIDSVPLPPPPQF